MENSIQTLDLYVISLVEKPSDLKEVPTICLGSSESFQKNFQHQ